MVPKNSMIEFVFKEHFRLALHAALLFAVGLFASYPVVKYRVRWLAAVPLALLRFVLRLIGPSPALARMAGVTWAFNSVVMFVYMATGFHPLLPKVLGVWMGLNIGTVIGMAPDYEELRTVSRPAAGQWAPPPGLARVCALLVPVLELPCFFYAVAMGMSMGQQVQSGALPYLSALAVRSQAYAALLVPILLASAVAEVTAIRGSGP